MEQAQSVIAKRLEAHTHHIRIKKLLLYATSGHWETDPNKLKHVAMQPILSQLHRLYPTTQQLRFYLYTIAANLTKSREYQQLSNIVLLECAGLYTNSGDENNDDEPTAFFCSPPTPPTPVVADAVVEEQCQIAQTLELMVERERIVKLMLCLLHDSWESNKEKIAQTSIRTLIGEIRRKYGSLIEIERQLISIVQRLSKAMEYSPLATTIVQQIAPIYDLHQEEATDQSWPAMQSIDGFNLRLEVVKFANPLRAKILLFSLLYHPFSDSEQDWSTLKQLSLEDLLKRVLESNTAAALGIKLVQMAQTLPQAAEYEPVVEVLIRALQLSAVATPVAPGVSVGSDFSGDNEATQLRIAQ